MTTPATSTTPFSTAVTTSATTNPSTGTDHGVSANFNLFLKMLTTQMTHQDPLNPTDSTQYTQQLAQYSQVEQTIQQTQTLQSILANLTAQNMTQAAALVGKQIEVSSATSGLSATAPASWRYAAAAPVSTLTATVTNATGTVVATRPITPGGTTGAFSWDGITADGSRAPAGPYTVAFAGTDANGASVAVSGHASGIVSEVGTSDGAVALTVNGVSQPMSSIVRMGG
jgi:flagellar basal-body rod modification protein FlgD